MRSRYLTLALGLALLGCSRPNHTDTSPAESVAARSAAPVDTAWRPLAKLELWRGYRSQTMPAMWTIDSGVLSKRGVGEDIVTREEFTDFVLEFDWMLDERGNSGLFYRATEEYDKIYWSAPEYALLDDARHPDGRNILTSAGAAHSLYSPPRGVVREANQWNTTRVVVKGTHVEHWLNGQKVVEFEYGSPDFVDRVSKSKFARWPNFAKAGKGVIGIQGDHGGVLQIRGLRIAKL